MIGKCIGPKKVFERYLTYEEKMELKELVEDTFNGSNKDFVLFEVFEYLQRHLTATQWNDIWPEIEYYLSLNLPCSPYASILPPNYYKALLKAVRNAGKAGRSKKEVKRLVDDYLDRILMDPQFQEETAHRFDYLTKQQVLIPSSNVPFDY
uniref:RGS domain-containing protein n=1 Tax=Strongyloides papillosus TaxID=174720 RepID=A0A0N5BCD0_STREA